MRRFQELPVFQQSHQIVLDIYRLSSKFPEDEKYGLTSQIRRCAVSIPANIVEGLHRDTTKQLRSFLYNARGSAGELLYHLLVANDLSYITSQEYTELDESIQGVIKQLNGWIKAENAKLK